MENNSLINPVCTIRHCDAAARYNFVIVGHPNGDAACSYCKKHVRECAAAGHWDDSPRPYSITVTGPFGGSN